MQIQVPVLGIFEFGRPQLYAALMLFALAVQAVIATLLQPVHAGFRPTVVIVANLSSPTLPSDSVLLFRSEQAATLPGCARCLDWVLRRPLLARVWLRLPTIIFSLWLGGALWWVSRRLYNNAGGYVALALYCSSPSILAASTRVNAEILAAWGLFGAIYTAIGVAHTLYAPPKKWRIRIVLLGVALGFTAAAHLAAGLVAITLGAFFMFYLAPGRRVASAAILLLASAIAAALLWALYGFGTNLRAWDFASILNPHTQLHAVEAISSVPSLPVLAALSASLIVFIVWKRTRYFGNWSALLVFIVLAALVPLWGPAVLIWALPFAFVFVGGIWADILERGYGRLAIILVIGLQAAPMIAGLIGAWFRGI